ncbi:MAG: HupE/UreJ family protein [Amphritea sp.]|nr:HupE/UreJ family protein [Amphritea sp.]
MKFSPLLTSTALLSLFVAVPAMAHTGHITASSLQAGLTHPFSGLDHLLAMLAIGFWAAMQKRTHQLSIPFTFLAFLGLGFSLALNGAVLPLIEQTIAVSVLVCGLIIATTVRLPIAVSLTLTALFALAHGQAHGVETAAGSALLFAIGFMSSSALLHLAGMATFKASGWITPRITQLAGLMLASIGSYLLMAA